MYASSAGITTWLSNQAQYCNPSLPKSGPSLKEPSAKRRRVSELLSPSLPPTPRSGSRPKKRRIDGVGRATFAAAEQSSGGVGDERQRLSSSGAPSEGQPPTLALTERTRLTASFASRSPTRESSANSRSSSPVQNSFDLARLEKPVLLKSAGDNPPLPTDISELYDAVFNISSYSDGIYPLEVEAELKGIMHIPPRDHCFRKPASGPLRQEGPESGDAGPSSSGLADTEKLPTRQDELLQYLYRHTPVDTSTRGLALSELQRVLELCEMASYLARQSSSEAVWNSQVHGPLLELGLRNHHRVESINATTAGIASAFMPRCSAPNNLPASGKMIDFALCLSLACDNRCPPTPWSAPPLVAPSARTADPKAPQPPQPRRAASTRRRIGDGEDEHDMALDDRICEATARAAAATWDRAHASVNQTAYTPLTRKPVAVAVAVAEAQRDGAADQALTQLGLWTAAWHKRMAAIAQGSESGLGASGYDGGDGGAARGGQDENEEADEAGDGVGNGEGGGVAVVTLPLVMVLGHGWKLMIACDRGDHVDILRDLTMGSTNSVDGIYSILAVLRQLGDWIQGPFRTWIDSVF